MKTLTLLRHAKSGWDDPSLSDFARPLEPRGRSAARAVGPRDARARPRLGPHRRLARRPRHRDDRLGLAESTARSRPVYDECVDPASLETCSRSSAPPTTLMRPCSSSATIPAWGSGLLLAGRRPAARRDRAQISDRHARGDGILRPSTGRMCRRAGREDRALRPAARSRPGVREPDGT